MATPKMIRVEAKKIMTTNNNEVIDQNFRQILKVIGVDDIVILEDLEGDDRRDFLLHCHQTFHSKFFTQILKNHIQTQVMFTADIAINYDQYMNGKMMVEGMKTIYDFYQRHAHQYDMEFKPDQEPFDKRAPFSKAKI